MRDDLTQRIRDIDNEKLGSILKDFFLYIGVVNSDLLTTRGKLIELNERLDRLEQQQQDPEEPQT